MVDCARLATATSLLASLLAGCGGASDGDCAGGIAPGALVSGAALFRVDLYDGLTCDALAATDFPVATLSRTFAAGAAIKLDAPAGHYAIVVTSYADASATMPLGTACSEGTYAPGAQSCLPLALDPVDLAIAAPSDLGPADLLALDLAQLPGAILARDTFQRADQLGWGTATDGQHWAAASATQVFSVAGGSGDVANCGNATYAVELGPVAGDAEITTTGAMTGVGGRWGAQLHFSASMSSYSAQLDGSTLTLRRMLNGATAILAMASFTATSGASYSIRFRVVGDQVMARAWPSAAAEPTSWTVTATDAAPLPPGLGGLRFSLPGTDTVSVSDFELTAQ